MSFFDHEEVKLLKELIKLTATSIRVQIEAAAELRITNRLLRLIVAEEHRVTGFTFTRTGETSMLPFAPGSSPVITITPQPAGVQLTQAAPVTTSSDPVNYPVVADATGLIVTINIPTDATVGAPPATLTTTYTNADGAVATSTSQPFGPIVAAVVDVTGFTFEQTS